MFGNGQRSTIVPRLLFLLIIFQILKLKKKWISNNNRFCTCRYFSGEVDVHLLNVCGVIISGMVTNANDTVQCLVSQP